MQEVWIGDKKTWYFYESFVNDVQKRDMKYRELKSRWYRDISVGQYVCATWETIYFLKWR
jgi:hypothetical protein